MQTRTTVQTLLFPKTRYSEKEACEWAKHHGFHCTKVDDAEHFWRVRQQTPSRFEKDSFRTVAFGEGGIEAVIGHLKPEYRH
jgi:hypothetical protein